MRLPLEPPASRAAASPRPRTDDMCACMDKVCADAVSAQLTRWGTELASRGIDQATPDEEQVGEMTTIVDRMTRCMMTAMTGHQPYPATP